jgi:antitoxin CcdA
VEIVMTDRSIVHPDRAGGVRRFKAPKRATNVSLDGALLDEARELGINVSRACERGLALQIAEIHAQRWLDENKPAIESSNAYVDRSGLPLRRYRRF